MFKVFQQCKGINEKFSFKNKVKNLNWIDVRHTMFKQL